MSIDKISGSLISGTNESSLSLANVKLDLSMIKVEVPAEYKGLSGALTSKRRTAAEEGTAHQTARRLGILFQGILPPTPELLRAYGWRSTEIGNKSLKSTEQNISDGIFAKYLGADITSVWAAATSGASSIAVHLLACLLARLWPATEATAIWVEIVAERRRQVVEQANQGVYMTSLELQLICREEFSRDDLAAWDSGARAWIQVADDAQMLRQKQLMLIINNIHLPVNTGGSTYDSVLNAWNTSLVAMESLLCGQPQRVVNGATLMGVASWHLYPDLLILGETISTVSFKDTLVPDTAKLTVGIENVNPERQDGIFWSLPLSHLRFYGDPVVANSHTTRDASRLTMDELQLLALGSAMAAWGNHYMEPRHIARFFCALQQAIGSQAAPRLNWLLPLFSASKTLLDAPGDEMEHILGIIALGRRNGTKFLSEKSNQPPPYFGLGNPFISNFLRQSHHAVDSEDVERLRFIATSLRLKPNTCIIRVRRTTVDPLQTYPGWGERADRDLYEYVTALPHLDCTFNGMGPKHIRWIESHSRAAEGTWGSQASNCSCHALQHNCHLGRCPCMQAKVSCTPSCHVDVDQSVVDYTSYEKVSKFVYRENDSVPLKPGPFSCENLPDKEFVFRPPVGVFKESESRWDTEERYDLGIGVTRPDHPQQCPQIVIQNNPRISLVCDCYSKTVVAGVQSTPTFMLLAGDPDSAALFVRVDTGRRQLRSQLRYALTDLAQVNPVDLEIVIKTLTTNSLDKDALIWYLQSISRQGLITLPRFRKTLQPDTYRVSRFIRSLNAIHVAVVIYQSLGGASVSLRVIDKPLYRAHWVPSNVFFAEGNMDLERPHRFSCIAFFESGTYDMLPSDLQDVIAISTRNSIFVSAALLSDPFGLSVRNDIRHVVGNVGKTGMIMMVAPLVPRVRPPNINKWKQITHAPFHGDAEDQFKSTSLHLSFTEFEMPFNIGQRGAIDRNIQVRVVETVISVYDRSEWLADLDILLLYEPGLRGHGYIKRLDKDAGTSCKKQKAKHGSLQPLTAIDNWEELLNLPDDMGQEHIGVIRSKGNWLARVATACVAVQRGYRTVILPSVELCWDCCSCKRWLWNNIKDLNGTTRDEEDENSDSYDAEGNYVEKADGEDHRLPALRLGKIGSLSVEDEDEPYYSEASDSSVVTIKADGMYEALPHVLIA
ncbi:hypothetical protein NPX13_g6449 [Xylaria arbuscula]|uniref:Uncharacterized protein n=1 Tax=Xylaria arbuscula TaxID=114810 RepID=A0A9W8TM52_9PEZI|nr:hypothetical protein NPX13_g6449 [Xylaria arbuscula]